MKEIFNSIEYSVVRNLISEKYNWIFLESVWKKRLYVSQLTMFVVDSFRWIMKDLINTDYRGVKSSARHMAPINMKLSPPGHDSPSDKTYWPNNNWLFQTKLMCIAFSKFFSNLFLKLFQSLELCPQFAELQLIVWYMHQDNDNYLHKISSISQNICKKWGLEGAKDQETISWAKTCRPLMGWGQLKRFPRIATNGMECGFSKYR